MARTKKAPSARGISMRSTGKSVEALEALAADLKGEMKGVQRPIGFGAQIEPPPSARIAKPKSKKRK